MQLFDNYEAAKKQEKLALPNQKNESGIGWDENSNQLPCLLIILVRNFLDK